MRHTQKRRGRFTDTRLSVDTGGDWKAHTGTLPKGCAVVGTVTLGESDTGALVRLAGSKNYVKVNGGKIAMLNQQKISTALQMAQRPSFAPEMVSVEEWERSQPPRTDEAEVRQRTGYAGGIVAVGAGFSPAPLMPIPKKLSG